jgi:hypothetical protein
MLKLKIFEVLKVGSHRKLSSPKLYLRLNMWTLRNFSGDVPLLGWDCIGHEEWDGLIDSVKWALESSRKKGHLIITKEDKILDELRRRGRKG